MSKQRINIDASSLKESSCDYRFYNIVVKGLRQPLPNNDTQYGSAFHKFTSTMHETSGNFNEAIKAACLLFDKPCIVKPKKKHLTKNHLVKTCLDYWEHFGKTDDFEVLHDNNDKPLVEIKFELLIYSTEDVEVYLCGTIDKIGKFKNGAYAIGDYKVTSSWDIVGYLAPYRLSTQLKVYHWALTEIGIRNPESAVAAITKYPVGVFIDGIFAKTNKDTEFHRSEVFMFKDSERAEFDDFIKIAAERILFISKYREVRRNGLINGSCHTGWGPCKFFDICAAPDDIARAHVIRNNFITKPYEPLKFGED